ncbi:MAG: PEP-CTERM sorting domain-containing protein, partial [Planctomycetes bacterium]|nr:PEP-CTERM sorting domain-containing protein [Planctomycetota bacterium]
ADAPLAYTANTWYHIAYVVTPTGYNLYVRDTAGSVIATGSGAYSGTPVLLDASHVLNMGRYSGGSEYLTGLIDDVAVWNRALSPAELAVVAQLGFKSTLVGGTLTTAGTTVFGQDALIDVPRINVTGGTLQGGKLWPPSARATLQPQTTLRLAGGQLIGGFDLTNPSTTAGSYALEVENGTGIQTATLIGPAASLRKTTAGSAIFSGEVTLNNIRVEAGSLTFAHGPNLTANNITVTGGSLTSHKNTTVGTLDLQSGTTTLTRHTTVTTAFQGAAGMLIADGSFDFDASSASLVNFGGTLRVTNSVPATSGNLLVKLPGATSMPYGGLIGYWPLNEGAGVVAADLSGKNNPGTINANATWVNDGTRGWVLNFPASGSVSIPAAAFASLANQGQATVSLWQFGDVANQPRNDTIFGGSQANGNRVLQSHLPWGDSNVYLDAGDNMGNRINKLATPAEFEGAWHNWVFVKDTSIGSLRIYLDGVQWHSGTGMNQAMPPITAFRIGSTAAGAENYYGMIDDFAVWNRPLAQSEITKIFQGGTFHPYLGNLRLDPSSQITLGGVGVATFATVGATGGLTISGGLDVAPTTSGPANVQGTRSGVLFNAAVTAGNFNVAGPGVVTLGTDASVAIGAGGTLTVPQGVAITSDPGAGGTATINASQGSVSYKGGLNVASGTLVLNGSAPVPRPANAMAFWGLNEASGTVASDVSGNNRFGTLINSPTWVPNGGVIGGALSFNDFNNYVIVPRTNNGGINIDNQSFTLAVWSKISPTAVAADYFFGQGSSAGLPSATDRALHVGRRDGTNETIAFYSDDLNYGNAAIVSDTANWHHWVITYDATTRAQSIYVDGSTTPVATRTAGGHFAAGGTTDFWLGQANGGNWFGGLLDEAAVYGRVLTLAERQNLYRAGLQGGYGAARFGDLTMAPGTTLVATSQPVGFSTAAIGGGTVANPTTMTGDITVDRRIAVSGTGQLLINGPGAGGSGGHLRVSDGLVYEWGFAGPTNHDLITILGDLHFEKSFTLRMFGEGGGILPTDYVPIFLYSGILDTPPGGLQYTIEIGNLADPKHLFVWDISDAELFVGLHEGQQGIWLHGLFAQAVPEPGTLAVLALGALALLRRRRRGQQK